MTTSASGTYRCCFCAVPRIVFLILLALDWWCSLIVTLQPLMLLK